MPPASRTPLQILADHPPCATAMNGSGMRCTCPDQCANWWLRAAGFKVEDPSWSRPCTGDNHGRCPKHPEISIHPVGGS